MQTASDHAVKVLNSLIETTLDSANDDPLPVEVQYASKVSAWSNS